MKPPDSTQSSWCRPLWAVLLFAVGLLLLAALTDIKLAYVVALLVIAGFLGSAAALWRRANAQADGSEWWQDEEASGWRGY